MKTYSAIVLTKVYKKVFVTVKDNENISTVKELLIEQGDSLWNVEDAPDEVNIEIYDLFEENMK